MKKAIKIALIILPWLLLSIIIYNVMTKQLFIVLDKNYNVVYGTKPNAKMLNNDNAYIIEKDGKKEIIEVKNKKVITKTLNKNSFEITSTQNPKLKFEVNLKDSLTTEKSYFETPEKIIAVSDLEGNFPVFIDFLKNNGVINDNLKWTFGKNHLVLNGDFFDRGTDVTALLWFIYELESQAEKNGGKVHFILGNHEIWNLEGKVKYVNRKYLALANELDINYKELYGEKSELGKWLRTKNSIIKINNHIFCHGGISKSMIDLKISIHEANELIRETIGLDKKDVCFTNSKKCFLLDRKGILWYRGYFGDYKNYYKGATMNDIDSILKFYNADNIIIGHTVVRRVSYLFDKKIIAIDVVTEDDLKNKNDDDNNLINYWEGLMIENGKNYVINTKSKPKELK